MFAVFVLKMGKMPQNDGRKEEKTGNISGIFFFRCNLISSLFFDRAYFFPTPRMSNMVKIFPVEDAIKSLIFVQIRWNLVTLSNTNNSFVTSIFWLMTSPKIWQILKMRYIFNGKSNNDSKIQDSLSIMPIFCWRQHFLRTTCKNDVTLPNVASSCQIFIKFSKNYLSSQCERPFKAI